jgi:hypothetical protein
LVKNALGVPKFPIYNEYNINWALKLNKPGSLTMDVPSRFCTGTSQTGFSVTDFSEDDRVELWRTTNGTRRLVGDSAFFLNKISSKLDSDGNRLVHVEGETATGIFGRRLNAYDSKDNNQNYKAPGILLATYFCRLFDRNMGANAKYYTGALDVTRRVDGLVTGVATINTATPFIACNAVSFNGVGTVNTDFESTGNKTLLSLFQQAADYSASKNENFFFDVVQVSNYASIYPHFELRTYLNQRGTDRTATVTVSDDNFTISEYELEFDYTNSARVYVTAGKNGTGQQIKKDTSIPAILLTDPFALRELFSSSSQTGTALQADADRNLQSHLPAAQLTGSLVTDETFIYDRDYFYGDRLNAEVEGVNLTVFVDTEEGSIKSGKETLKIGISSNLNRRLTGAGAAIQAIIDNQKAISELQSVIAA